MTYYELMAKARRCDAESYRAEAAAARLNPWQKDREAAEVEALGHERNAQAYEVMAQQYDEMGR